MQLSRYQAIDKNHLTRSSNDEGNSKSLPVWGVSDHWSANAPVKDALVEDAPVKDIPVEDNPLTRHSWEQISG